MNNHFSAYISHLSYPCHTKSSSFPALSSPHSFFFLGCSCFGIRMYLFKSSSIVQMLPLDSILIIPSPSTTPSLASPSPFPQTHNNTPVQTTKLNASSSQY